MGLYFKVSISVMDYANLMVTLIFYLVCQNAAWTISLSSRILKKHSDLILF